MATATAQVTSLGDPAAPDFLDRALARIEEITAEVNVSLDLLRDLEGRVAALEAGETVA